MPFQNQFSLSVELTKFVSLSQIAEGTFGAALKLARALQSSGSDIVVEADVVEIFGYSHITPILSSSFRTAVSLPHEPEELIAGISLFRGPGPTVLRALKNEAYFSTIVQCSFFLALYERESLALCIARYLEKLADQAAQTPGKEYEKTPPSTESINGMLRACEEQTQGYAWRKHLDAVTAMLGEDPSTAIYGPLAQMIMHGLFTMLPSVQRIPDDRYISIETERGVATIVVWAHVLLGLRVSVEREDESGKKILHFPGDQKSAPQVFIKKYSNHPSAFATISLLAAVDHEVLLNLVAEVEEGVLDMTRRYPLRNLAKAALSLPSLEGRDRVLEEMMYFSCSQAMLVAQQLHHRQHNLEFHQPFDDIERIFDVVKLLFDDNETKFKAETAYEYADFYSKKNFSEIDAPNSVITTLDKWEKIAKGIMCDWEELKYISFTLCAIILALSHVAELEACAEMLFSSVALHARSDLIQNIQNWDGQSKIPIESHTWLEIIALGIVGSEVELNLNLDGVALLSNAGWTVLVNTFGKTDSSLLDPGFVTIKKGVPYRHGVTKHRVHDQRHRSHGFYSNIDQTQKSGELATMCCVRPLKLLEPLFGDIGDSFSVALRIQKTGTGGDGILITGIRQLWDSRFMAQKIKRCKHNSDTGETLLLEPRWVTCTGIEHSSFNPDGNLAICLTANNSVSRWAALVATMIQRTYLIHLDKDAKCKEVKLRGQQTCFRCAVSQANSEMGADGCILVL